jgi:hypothetical protein
MFKRISCIAALFIGSYPGHPALASNPDCELIQFDLHCSVTDGILSKEYLYVIQINTRAGERYAKVAIPFAKGDKITDLKGNIEDTDGKIIRVLSRKDITDVSAVSDEALYTDDYVRTFELIHNQYPYRIRYSYRIEFKEFFYIANWFPVLGENIPIHQASVEADVPLDFPIKVKTNAIPEPTYDTTGTRVNFRCEISDIPGYRAEEYAPSPISTLPGVDIIPGYFKWYVDGSNTSWKTYGEWESKLIDGMGALPLSEKSKVKSIVSNLKDDREKVKQLYYYLQDNTRYIFVKIDAGGMRPYPAEYVSLHKYGDCKALTNYMKSLLGEAGIISYYTNALSDQNPAKTDTSFPCMQFNHVFLYVPLKEDTFFLECTSNTRPFAYVGTHTHNRPVFVIDGSNSHFVYTPALKMEAVRNIRKMTYSIGAEGSARVSMSCSFKGYSYELFDAVLSQLNTKRQEDFIREIIPAVNFDLIDWHLERCSRDSAEIRLTATLGVSNAIRRYGNDQSVQPHPIFSASFDAPGKRKLPVVFNYPEYLTDSLFYTFSDVSNRNNISDEINFTGKYGVYIRKVSCEENRLFVVRTLKLNAGEYNLAEYPDFYKFITDIQQADRKNILISKQ